MSFKRQEIRKKKYNNNNKLIIIIVVFIILFSLYIYGKSKYENFKTENLIIQNTDFSIDSDDTFLNLGKKIPELNNFYYKIYIKYNKPDFELKEGSFELKIGENIDEIFESLQNPLLEEINITILEGWNIYDIDLNLTKKGLIEKGDYINYVTNKEKIVALSEFFAFLDNNDLESLEGFLYPDTYKVINKNFKINEFVIMQLDNFEEKVYNKLFEGNYDNSTIYDVINLASIVEREENNTENLKTVAGILKKRLNNNWLIGADATVCYPYEITSFECTQSFINNHVTEKNDYNTRTMRGLPKTPISNPNYITIEATLNDKKTDYWFYLHNNSGKIYYAEDEATHEYNINNYMNN